MSVLFYQPQQNSLIRLHAPKQHVHYLRLHSNYFVRITSFLISLVTIAIYRTHCTINAIYPRTLHCHNWFFVNITYITRAFFAIPNIVCFLSRSSSYTVLQWGRRRFSSTNGSLSCTLQYSSRSVVTVLPQMHFRIWVSQNNQKFIMRVTVISPVRSCVVRSFAILLLLLLDVEQFLSCCFSYIRIVHRLYVKEWSLWITTTQNIAFSPLHAFSACFIFQVEHSDSSGLCTYWVSDLCE